MVSTPLLEFNDATVIIKGARVLERVSFRIDVGEHAAIMGPNGSGKSTLIKTITRELHPVVTESGPPVRILGEHMWNIFNLWTMIGIVSSDLQQVCTRDISGWETVMSGFFGSIGIYPYHKVTEQMEDRTRHILEFLEASHLAQKNMTEMSTGEARRMLIGRALVNRPKALMLDEPANGLDPHAARKFSGMLRKIARSGKSIIMVTHHLHDIIPEIDRVIMVKDGKLFRDGAKQDVLTEKNLSELFGMPVKIRTGDGYYHLWS